MNSKLSPLKGDLAHSVENLAAFIADPVEREEFRGSFASSRPGDLMKAARRASGRAKGRGEKPLRLLFLRTFTVELLLPAIELALSAFGREVEIEMAPLGEIESAMGGRSEDPRPTVVFWRWEQVLGYDSANLSAAKIRIEDFVSRASGGEKVFVMNFEDPAWAFASDPSLKSAVGNLNAALEAAAGATPNVRIIDMAGFVTGDGGPAYDPWMDFRSMCPYGVEAFGPIALFIVSTLRAGLFAPKKVLAVDLDNTLWGGILGEGGPEALSIGHSYPGNIFRRIQEEILALKRRGVILALVTKNNLPDVEEAFSLLKDEMSLTLEDFSAVKADWEPKPENLAEIAEELNLGLESFVFLDDSAFEREMMRARLAIVHLLVPEVYDDPVSLWVSLAKCRVFETESATEEDLLRVTDYRAQQERKRLLSEANGVEEYLHDLKMRLSFEEPSEVSMARAEAMIHKTNQFNLTTRRHSRADIDRFVQEGVFILVRLDDRFASQGLIGLAIAEVLDKEVGVIDSFLLSCRALGRGVETALLAECLRRLKEVGVTEVRAEFLPTAKNSQVKEFYSAHGFKKVADDEKRTVYSLSLKEKIPQIPPWFRLTAPNAKTLTERV